MKYLFLLTFSLILFQCSCKRTTDTLGPDACPSANFKVLSPLVIKDNASSSETSLDLSASYAKISAAFNEVITYKLIVTGQTSGAVYEYNGKSATIALSWYGNSTNGKYFKKGELLVYTLTNICKAESIGSGQIMLSTIIGYNGFGFKVVNFEESPALAMAQYGDFAAGACAASMKMTPASPGYEESPQGGNYYRFSSSCTNAASGKSWYFGGADFTGVNFAALGTDPTRVYLNFFAKGQSNSQAQMIFKETLYGSDLTRKFLANVSPGAWTLYSVKLSDIGILDPSKISTLSFNLGAAAYQDVSASVDLDLVIFTFDKPF